MSKYENGVDWIVSKPYSIRLFSLQLKALTRRLGSIPLTTLPTCATTDMQINPNNRTVLRADNTVQRLSHLEFRLLYTLMMQPQRPFTTDELVEKIWGYTGEGDTDLVRKLVRRVRVKVESNPSQPHYILTVPGIGYQFGA